MTVKLLYIGRRLVRRKLHQTFLWRGKEHYWTGVRGLQIGFFYASELTGKRHTMSQEPKRLEWAKREADVEKWVALDLAAKGTLSAERAARLDRQDKSVAALLEKLEPLRTTITAMDYSEKRGFFEFMLDHFSITRVPSTKKLREKNKRLAWHNKELDRQLRRALKKGKK